MKDIACKEDYTYPRFILYLYLCAAYADYQINEEEKELIREKMKRYNMLSEEDFVSNWHKVSNDFKKHNDLESMQYIESCYQHLHMDPISRLKIYRDFEEIMEVDGHEDDSERNALFRLKKMLSV